MIRAIRIALVLCAVASCGGDDSAAGSLAEGGVPGAGGYNSGAGGTDNPGAGGGNSGNGGTNGSGGHSAGAFGAGGFETRRPVRSDGRLRIAFVLYVFGCNDYRCSGTLWISNNRCNLDAQTDAPTGVCNQDSDCEFRKNVACCGVCLARSDPSPGGACPPGAGQCAPYQPNCVCINHHCGTGALNQHQSCSASHDLCGPGLKCCPTCDGAAASSEAGSGCSSLACSIAYPSATGPNSCSL